jgi:cell division protein FtsI/penicillin-binding protein 2
MMAAAAAFDSGKVRLTDHVNGQGGTCLVGTFTVTDVKKVGVVTVLEAIKYSSNCAMKEVALRTGVDKLHETLRKFGIGQGTGVDLPAEARGVLRPAKDWASTTLQTAGYGYGYSLSLLEIAGAAQTIANDGVRMVPRIAFEVRSAGGETLTRFEPRPAMRVVSVEAARDVRKCLTAVVMDPDGTGTRARPNGYSAAGKTGTARANVAGKGYVHERFLTSFVGFAPAEDPSIVIAITVIDPKVNRFGGTVSGPVFRAVVEQTLPLRGILPVVADVKKGNGR